MGPLSAPGFFAWDDLERQAEARAQMERERAERVMAKLPPPAPYDPWAMPEEEEWKMPSVQEKLLGWIEGVGVPAGMVQNPAALAQKRRLFEKLLDWWRKTHPGEEHIPLWSMQQKGLKQAAETEAAGFIRKNWPGKANSPIQYGELNAEEMARFGTRNPRLEMTPKGLAHEFVGRQLGDQLRLGETDAALDLAFNSEQYGLPPAVLRELPPNANYAAPRSVYGPLVDGLWTPQAALKLPELPIRPVSIRAVVPENFRGPNALDVAPKDAPNAGEILGWYNRGPEGLNLRSLPDPLIEGLDWLRLRKLFGL